MQSRKISCICPTYNRHEWLEKSIVMFLKQTYNNKELVIIDDSPQIFKSKFLKNKNIKYFHYKKKFSSIGEKRNKCIEKSTGSIITHWDDDDYNHSERLEEQVKHMKNPKNIVVFKDTLIYDVKNNNLKKPSDKKRCELWYRCVILSAMMFDKKIWEKIKFRNISLAEDAYFLKDAVDEFGDIMVTMSNNTYGNTKQPLFVYTKHDSSTWTQEFKDMSKWKTVKLPIILETVEAELSTGYHLKK